MNAVSLSLANFALGALCIVSGLVSSARAEEYVKAYPVAGHAEVRVRADDSSVHITTWDESRVEFRVTYKDFGALRIGGKLHIDSNQNGDQVELTEIISPGFTIGVSYLEMHTEVRMPKNANLQLEVHDGAVELASLKGNINVRTGDGAINASQLSGKIDLRSGDGAIEALDLDGQCTVSSGDGTIHARGRFDSLDVQSGDGSIQVQVAAGSKITSPWSIRTHDGSVGLAVPKDLAADLDLSSRDGHVKLGIPVAVQGEISDSEVRGTINGGGPVILVHTGDGSIRLTGI